MKTKKSTGIVMMVILIFSIANTELINPKNLSIPLNEIIVSGTGTASIIADTASISLSITAINTTAKLTSDTINRYLNQLSVALISNGLNTNSLSTGYFYLNPIFNYSNNPPSVSGYAASVSVNVNIPGVDKNNNLIANVIDSILMNVGGVSSVYGITYTQSNPNLGLDKARAAAFSQAQAKATQYALLSKRKLGNILSIEDSAPTYFYGYTAVSTGNNSSNSSSSSSSSDGIGPSVGIPKGRIFLYASIPANKIIVSAKVIVVYALN